MPQEHAEAWRRYLEVHLCAPRHYRPVFAAEDVVSTHRVQWSHFQEDCRATSQRLAELQTQMEGTLAYSHLGEQQASEVKERLEALDAERVDLLRHQNDLPGVGQLIHAALETAQAALGEAETTLHQAQVAHHHAQHVARCEARRAQVAPLVAGRREDTIFDERCKALGLDPYDWGSRAIWEPALAPLRK
jgi:hypothetical protein